MEDRRRIIKTDLISRLSALVLTIKVDEPLKNHTSFHIGGPARCLVEIKSRDELLRLWNFAMQEKIEILFLGSGSNMLVGDHGFDGIVVKLSGDFLEIEFNGENVKAGAGVRLPVLINQCVEKSLDGMECLAGIPGTLGGALIGNAGTSYGSIGEITSEVEILSNSGKFIKLKPEDLSFSYRQSNLAGKIVVGAELYLKKGPKNDTLKKINDQLLRRSEVQPAGLWCAGSIFKNPPGDSAGRLIESAGFKGLAFGGAQVSEKHANFIVNTGGATASDVRALILMIHTKVKEKYGIELELEIKLAGR